MDLNILIRTMTLRRPRVIDLRAGGGIVADSIPERELEETRAKARGMLAVFEAERRESRPEVTLVNGAAADAGPFGARSRAAFRRRAVRDHRLPRGSRRASCRCISIGCRGAASGCASSRSMPTPSAREVETLARGAPIARS